MAYNYSKGPQVIGDLKAADDAQRDTKIDFEEDYIALHTSGSAVLTVSGSNVGIGTTSPSVKLHVVSDVTGKGQIRVTQHNTDADAPDLRFHKSRGTEANPSAVADADNLARINSYAHNGSGYVQAGSFGWSANGTAGDSTFDIKTRVSNTKSIRLNINANGAIVFNEAYRFPTADGNNGQVLQTNGNGVLTFVDVDDGGGGDGGGPQTPEVLKVGISSDFNVTGGASDPYQTLLLDNVEFDTFTGGAGWNTGSYNFVAKEAGYYEFQASFVFDAIQSDITQYQIYLVSSGSGSTLSQAGVPFIALNQYNNNPAQIDMRTFHLSTIANFSVNQSASIQIRQIDGTANTTKIKGGINQTFLTIKKL